MLITILEILAGFYLFLAIKFLFSAEERSETGTALLASLILGAVLLFVAT